MRLPFLLLSLVWALPASGQTVVVNQGNFSTGDGSLTLIPEFFGGSEQEVQLFDGQFGSILQSATESGDNLYVVSNSANRIEVIDLESRTRTGQITGGLSSPRYFALVSDVFGPTKAYVSNHVYGGVSYVSPIDLATQAVGTAIEVDGLPEAIAVQPTRDGKTKAYVALGTFGAGSGVDSLAVLDAEADTLLRYIDIGCYARFVREAFDEDVVLAFCEDTDEAVVIDAEADTVRQRLAFGEEIGDPFGVGQSVGPGSRPIAVRRPPSIEHYVITASGIAVVEPVSQDEYAITRTIPIPEAGTRPISAVALSPGAMLVLGRPDPDNPFSADGTITVHNPDDGALRATYPAGIYPSHIVRDEQYPIASEGAPEAAGLGLALAGANPVRHHTALDLALERPASVRVDLLDGLGRYVQTVTAGDRVAGVHRLRLDVGGLAPGTYVARAVADGRVASLPVTIVR